MSNKQLFIHSWEIDSYNSNFLVHKVKELEDMLFRMVEIANDFNTMKPTRYHYPDDIEKWYENYRQEKKRRNE